MPDGKTEWCWRGQMHTNLLLSNQLYALFCTKKLWSGARRRRQRMQRCNAEHHGRFKCTSDRCYLQKCIQVLELFGLRNHQLLKNSVRFWIVYFSLCDNVCGNITMTASAIDGLNKMYWENLISFCIFRIFILNSSLHKAVDLGNRGHCSVGFCTIITDFVNGLLIVMAHLVLCVWK